MKVRDWLSAAGIGMRGLVLLRKLVKAQERIALASEQRVLIMAARAGVKPSKLQDYLADLEKEPEGEATLLTQSNEELQALYLQEMEAQARGIGVEDLEDLEELFNREKP